MGGGRGPLSRGFGSVTGWLEFFGGLRAGYWGVCVGDDEDTSRWLVFVDIWLQDLQMSRVRRVRLRMNR